MGASVLPVVIASSVGDLLVDIGRELFHGHNEIEHYGLPALWIVLAIGVVAWLSND